MKLLLIILPHWPLQVRKFLLHFYFFIWLMDVLSLTFRTVSYHHPHQDLLTEWLSPSGFHLLWNLLSYIFFFFPLRSTVLPPFCLSSTIRIYFFFQKYSHVLKLSFSFSSAFFYWPKENLSSFLAQMRVKMGKGGRLQVQLLLLQAKYKQQRSFHYIGQMFEISQDRAKAKYKNG